jgi:hypothetical protein
MCLLGSRYHLQFEIACILTLQRTAANKVGFMAPIETNESINLYGCEGVCGPESRLESSKKFKLKNRPLKLMSNGASMRASWKEHTNAGSPRKEGCAPDGKAKDLLLSPCWGISCHESPRKQCEEPFCEALPIGTNRSPIESNTVNAVPDTSKTPRLTTCPWGPPSEETLALMEQLDEAATLVQNRTQVLRESFKASSSGRGHMARLTSEVLAEYDACFPEMVMTVRMARKESQKPTRLRNRPLVVLGD